jgi:hypothetical protein
MVVVEVQVVVVAVMVVVEVQVVVVAVVVLAAQQVVVAVAAAEKIGSGSNQSG